LSWYFINRSSFNWKRKRQTKCLLWLLEWNKNAQEVSKRQLSSLIVRELDLKVCSFLGNSGLPVCGDKTVEWFLIVDQGLSLLLLFLWASVDPGEELEPGGVSFPTKAWRSQGQLWPSWLDTAWILPALKCWTVWKCLSNAMYCQFLPREVQWGKMEAAQEHRTYLPRRGLLGTITMKSMHRAESWTIPVESRILSSQPRRRHLLLVLPQSLGQVETGS
jgi:hypothetical protein